MSELNLYDKLLRIQVELKAPKNLYNSFGKYKYRNAESIQEAVKPLLLKYDCALTLSDDMHEISGKVYVNSTATLIDCKSGKFYVVSAYAREADDKKGMDAAQVTGATSSYSRKMALGGLFLLDDSNDPDAEEYQEKAKKAAAKKPAAKPQAPETTSTDNEAAMTGNARALLKELLVKYKINPQIIVKKCNLSQTSTEKDWEKAYKYTKELIEEHTKQNGGQENDRES